MAYLPNIFSSLEKEQITKNVKHQQHCFTKFKLFFIFFELFDLPLSYLMQDMIAYSPPN